MAEKIAGMMPLKIRYYVEPFVGSGAVFLSLDPERYQKAFLCDLNFDVVNAYQVVQRDVERLIKLLSDSTKFPSQVDKDRYLAIRDLDPDKLSPISRAARFLYLVKTCFNGLWRIGREGQMNTSFGDRRWTFDADNYRACSQALQRAKIAHSDFRRIDFGRFDERDCVYFDPPYLPRDGKKAGFTAYCAEGFDDRDQADLAEVFSQIANSGACVIASNSACTRARELYSGHDLEEIVVRRSINASRETSAKEFLIKGKRGRSGAPDRFLKIVEINNERQKKRGLRGHA